MFCSSNYLIFRLFSRFLQNIKVSYLPISSSQCLQLSTNEPPKVKRKVDWLKAIYESEKAIGYPTSFLNLRLLLNDDIANTAGHFRKLIEINHPFVRTIKNVLLNEGGNFQMWGLVVLLISKAAGHMNIQVTDKEKALGILYSQRVLAEVTHMIHMSHLAHKEVVNIKTAPHHKSSVINDLVYGNKIALLCGDYLLANACKQLAELRNQNVVELMSTAVCDISQSACIGRRDGQNIPLPSKGKQAEEEWTIYNTLTVGNFLGLSCKAALQLAEHTSEIQEKGFLFGKHLALAWQARLDMEPFIKHNEPCTPFSLVSAPVLFQLECDSGLFDEIDKGSEFVDNVDYKKIHKAVCNGSGLLQTKQLLQQHSIKVKEALKSFEENDTKEALMNIINSFNNCDIFE